MSSVEGSAAAMGVMADAVTVAAGKLGVTVTPEEAQLVQAWAATLVDAISRQAWKDAEAKGQAAADALKTEDDAEAARRAREGETP